MNKSVMYCPGCRGEFRPGLDWCASCDQPLVSEQPNDDPFRSKDTMADYLRDKELEQLVTANQELLIQLQRKLAAQRIATVITTESEEHRAMGRFMLLSRFQIWVGQKSFLEMSGVNPSKRKAWRSLNSARRPAPRARHWSHPTSRSANADCSSVD